MIRKKSNQMPFKTPKVFNTNHIDFTPILKYFYPDLYFLLPKPQSHIIFVKLNNLSKFETFKILLWCSVKITAMKLRLQFHKKL